MTLPKLTNKSITIFGRADTPKIKSLLGSFERCRCKSSALMFLNLLIKLFTTVGLSNKELYTIFVLGICPSSSSGSAKLPLNNTHSLICQRFSIKVENFRGFFFDSLSINSLILPLGS